MWKPRLQSNACIANDVHTLHLNQSWSLYEVHDSYDFKECTEPDCDYDSDDGCDCGDEAEFDYDEDLVLRCDDCHLKHRDRIRHFKPRRLQNLDLTSCTFTNSDFLKFLHFIGCVKSGYQASMKSLHLDRTEVTFDDLLPATSLSLQSLSIEGRHLSETGITFFLKVVAKNLTTLNLGETNISFSGFISNADNPVFTSLKEVNLSGCKQVTDEGLSSFLSVTREKLETLDLSKTAITLSTIGSLPSLPLKNLCLRECENLTEMGLLELLEKAGATLRTLDLSGCKQLTDEGLSAFLSTTGDKLRTLDLSKTTISLSTVGSVPTALYLEQLSLRECQNLTESGLLELLEKTGATLRTLDLRQTNLSTPFKESALVARVSGLAELDLKH